MKDIIHLALKTEYTFKKAYGYMDRVVNYASAGAVGVADINGTFGHVKLEKVCAASKVKPIFGVRLTVVANTNLREGKRAIPGPEFIFIAKNVDGLQEIYRLVEKAYRNFYFRPMVGLVDVWSLSDNIIVIASNVLLDEERIDYIAHTPRTDPKMLDCSIPKVAICDNLYQSVDDKDTYQLFAGSVARGGGYVSQFESHTYPSHILSTDEWMRLCKNEEAINNTHIIAEQCDVVLPKATMVRYKGAKKLDEICEKGAVKKNIDLTDEVYKARYDREMALIKEKNYVDYFLIVSEMVVQAKKIMLVGPSRGSSAGSLVCYLAGITEIDPIVHDLLFERFIDVNRHDLPDIDIDFPDNLRDKVMKKLAMKYGDDHVKQIANINRMKPKSALGNFALELGIPKYEVDAVKDAILDRSGGDARAAMRMVDTFETTDAGREFIEKYPIMKIVEHIENHASHIGKHAAGVIACNEPLTDYAGINTRENVVMMDKKEAEYLNLLKIDVLGLRTLTIVQSVAAQIEMPFEDFYDLPLDDEKVFNIFKEMRLNGIFQFEGSAMRSVTKQMGVDNFNDIVAITALARPGPLHSGGAGNFIRRRIGEEPVKYMSENPDYVAATKDTFGIIIYQEQLMNLCRTVGDMTWKEVAEIRLAASRSLGEEFFNQYRDSFLNGTRRKGMPDHEAMNIWENMVTFGSWGMNKSHTVSYGVISYWTAWCKAYHPVEFAVANLNNTKNERSALKLLRDMVDNDGLEYCPVDADESTEYWRVKDGVVLGGLTNIHGIGYKKARDIMKRRIDGPQFTPSMMKMLLNPETPFDILYPTQHYWGVFYDDYEELGLPDMPAHIVDADKEGEYTIIGKVVMKDLRDLNDYNEVMKRGGRELPDNHLFLKLVVEDDTDQIICRIGRFDFTRLDGQHLSDHLLVNETWVIIRGRIENSWRVLTIDAIGELKLEEVYEPEEIEERFGT